ncbi:hypothetical protein SRB5_33310 [Streptomyces sp. RB5]|uniref:HTH marR-type domain-containing protein n=1 Tax=Streptomyces smaragdinus TaxID=2585196 RepID=A0A7K0CI92_9ACTN|nr:MarR family transcriptional regulator [Streptomyces smaragdinus]MQY13188.1 hypothetical protein [Streptomyces smaragdinus]
MAANELEAVLLDQLTRLAGWVAGVMQEALEGFGLTVPQANLLWVVDPATAAVPLGRLAARLHCDPSNVTLLCAQLEEKGLAERRPYPGDGRVRTLVLTERGADARRRLLALVAARSPFAVLDEDERRRLTAMLAKALMPR